MTDKIVVRIDRELEEIVPEYLKMTREDLTSILKAVDTGDFETVRVLGHRLKGSGGGYGFDRITEIGSRIERHAENRDAGQVRRCEEELRSYLARLQILYE